MLSRLSEKLKQTPLGGVVQEIGKESLWSAPQDKSGFVVRAKASK